MFSSERGLLAPGATRMATSLSSLQPNDGAYLPKARRSFLVASSKALAKRHPAMPKQDISDASLAAWNLKTPDEVHAEVEAFKLRAEVRRKRVAVARPLGASKQPQHLSKARRFFLTTSSRALKNLHPTWSKDEVKEASMSAWKKKTEKEIELEVQAFISIDKERKLAKSLVIPQSEARGFGAYSKEQYALLKIAVPDIVSRNSVKQSWLALSETEKAMFIGKDGMKGVLKEVKMCLDDMLALVGTISLMVAHVAGESKYRINRNKTAADLEKITNVCQAMVNHVSGARAYHFNVPDFSFQTFCHKSGVNKSVRALRLEWRKMVTCDKRPYKYMAETKRITAEWKRQVRKSKFKPKTRQHVLHNEAFAFRAFVSGANEAFPIRGGTIPKTVILHMWEDLTAEQRNIDVFLYGDSSECEDDDDSSDPEESDSSNSGGERLWKEFVLSPALAEVCGKGILSRQAAMSKIWVYIKANRLQNPQKKREILCDAKLKAVMNGKDKITNVEIMKFLSMHLSPQGHTNPEEDGSCGPSFTNVKESESSHCGGENARVAVNDGDIASSSDEESDCSGSSGDSESSSGDEDSSSGSSSDSSSENSSDSSSENSSGSSSERSSYSNCSTSSSESSSEESENEGEECAKLVGREAKIFWPLDKKWYHGCIDKYDPESGRHTVRYKDGAIEELVLKDEKIQYLVDKRNKKLERKASNYFKYLNINISRYMGFMTAMELRDYAEFEKQAATSESAYKEWKNFYNPDPRHENCLIGGGIPRHPRFPHAVPCSDGIRAFLPPVFHSFVQMLSSSNLKQLLNATQYDNVLGSFFVVKMERDPSLTGVHGGDILWSIGGKIVYDIPYNVSLLDHSDESGGDATECVFVRLTDGGSLRSLHRFGVLASRHERLSKLSSIFTSYGRAFSANEISRLVTSLRGIQPCKLDRVDWALVAAYVGSRTEKEVLRRAQEYFWRVSNGAITLPAKTGCTHADNESKLLPASSPLVYLSYTASYNSRFHGVNFVDLPCGGVYVASLDLGDWSILAGCFKSEEVSARVFDAAARFQVGNCPSELLNFPNESNEKKKIRLRALKEVLHWAQCDTCSKWRVLAKEWGCATFSCADVIKSCSEEEDNENSVPYTVAPGRNEVWKLGQNWFNKVNASRSLFTDESVDPALRSTHIKTLLEEANRIPPFFPDTTAELNAIFQHVEAELGRRVRLVAHFRQFVGCLGDQNTSDFALPNSDFPLYGTRRGIITSKLPFRCDEKGALVLRGLIHLKPSETQSLYLNDKSVTPDKAEWLGGIFLGEDTPKDTYLFKYNGIKRKRSQIMASDEEALMKLAKYRSHTMQSGPYFYDASDTEMFPNGLVNTNVKGGAYTAAWGKMSQPRQSKACGPSNRNLFLNRDYPDRTLITVNFGPSYNTTGFVRLECVPEHRVGEVAAAKRIEAEERARKRREKEGFKVETIGPKVLKWTGEHNDACQYCSQGGVLLCCDFCSLSFHLSCLGLASFPLDDVDWSCPFCTKGIAPDEQIVGMPEPTTKRRKTAAVVDV